jgi:hypothetical protein
MPEQINRQLEDHRCGRRSTTYVSDRTQVAEPAKVSIVGAMREICGVASGGLGRA